MTVYNIIGGFLFFLGLVYAMLGYIAYFHINKERGVDTGWTLSLVWALNSHAYDGYGKRLCVIGKPIFLVVWGGFLILLVFKIIGSH